MKIKASAFLCLSTALFLINSAALACHSYYHHHCCKQIYYPKAYCTTVATNQPMIPYVCCQLTVKGRHGWHTAWHNTWVAGSCKNADYRARGDMGCAMNSPVYTTHAPIVGNCTFNSSTRDYR